MPPTPKAQASSPPATPAPARVPALTDEQVILAYRLFFDRDPESADVVAHHVAHQKSLKGFRHALLTSQEFRARTSELFESAAVTKPLTWPAIRVDAEVSPAALAAMIGLVEQAWEEFGRTEPHWSVLTSEAFKQSNIAQNEEAFYASGEESTLRMITALQRSEVDTASLRTCFELGCGVGRVTLWLAQRFARVFATDISRPHLDLAADAARRAGLTNIAFKHTNSIDDLRELPGFDAFFSVIVLQHNPPPVIHAILDAILGRLNPGGTAYFQVPTYCYGYSFDADRYIAEGAVKRGMEMHVLPQHKIYALFEKHGLMPLEVREDPSAGGEFVSSAFLARKRR